MLFLMSPAMLLLLSDYRWNWFYSPAASSLALTLDSQEDLKEISNLLGRLFAPNGDFRTAENTYTLVRQLEEILRHNPDVVATFPEIEAALEDFLGPQDAHRAGVEIVIDQHNHAHQAKSHGNDSGPSPGNTAGSDDATLAMRLAEFQDRLEDLGPFPWVRLTLNAFLRSVARDSPQIYEGRQRAYELLGLEDRVINDETDVKELLDMAESLGRQANNLARHRNSHWDDPDHHDNVEGDDPMPE